DGPRIYLVAGNAYANPAVSDVRVYNPFSDTLATMPTDPWPAAGSTVPGGQAVFNNRLYILGGLVTANNTLTDQIWEFDPNRAPGARWVLKNAHLPQPRAYIPAA